MALDTVSDYLSTARTLLQDQYSGQYRYSDAELVAGLNLALLEMYRLRPDLYIGITTVPSYSAGSLATQVAIDQRYRTAALYYICGHAQLRDEEQTEDARAGAFMSKFLGQMLTVQA
jgi:hypothetical protein